jgi:membrane protease YdiL (CAAX protease family)
MSAAPDDLPTDGPESLPLLEESEATPVLDTEPVTELIASSEPQESATPTTGKYRLPHAGRALLWVLLMFASQLALGLAVGIVIAVVLIATGQIQFQRGSPPNLAEIEPMVNRVLVPIATLITLLFSLGVVLLLFRRETARCMGLRGMTVTQGVLVLLSVLPCALLASEVTNCAAELLPNMSMELFGDFAKEPWWLVFVAACLFPGFGEELFFRGFLSRGLVAHHGPWLGTLIAAFYFGAIHLHPIQACGAFALGLALQFVFLTTRSLWAAILLHTANNAVAFLAMRYGHLVPIPGFTSNAPAKAAEEGIPVPRFDELPQKLDVGGPGAIAHTAPLLLVAAVVVVAAIAWAMLRTRTRWLRPDGTEWTRGFLSAEGPRPEVPVQTVTGSLDGNAGIVLVLANIAFFATLYFHIQR